MKRAIIAFALLLAIPAVAQFGGDAAGVLPFLRARENKVLALRPLAWYRGEGNALDSSGNNNHASWNVALTEAYTNGIAGRALSFRSGEYLAFAPPSAVYASQDHQNSWAVSLWFRFTASSGSASASGLYKATSTTGSGTGGAGIQVNNQAFTGGLARRVGARFRGATPSTYIESDTNVADETWTHVVFSHDHTTGDFALWVDGAFQGEAAAVEVSAPITSAMASYRFLGNEAALNGDLDEVLIFDRALTSDEIAILANPANY